MRFKHSFNIKSKRTSRIGIEDLQKELAKKINKYIDEGGTNEVFINNVHQSIKYCRNLKKLSDLAGKISGAISALTVIKSKRKLKPA